MTNVIDVRRVAPDQWQQLRDIRLAALRDAPDAFASTYEREAAFDEATWRSRTQSSAQFFAIDGEQIVGIAAGYHDPVDCAPDERSVVSMWVAPSHRGQGIVALLVDAIADWARHDGAAALRLDIATGNDSARQAYLRAGFVVTGSAKPMPRDPSIIEQTMTLAL